MSHFRLHWQPRALDDLADIWIKASGRAAVNMAVDLLEAQLAEDPMAWGTQLSEGLYQISIRPVRLLFTCDANQHTVKVLHARRWPAN
ncbi:MAG TPA: type II toxin-antitoxin system RelE/ParE family toxin [Pirellulales bacterium]|nr:type II toxin-antitoxin system RelE/ParE family toxin [Pirellulales bacterium]